MRYLHGRPGPHPLHGRFARAVGGEFEFIDFRMRWQDRSRSRLYTLTSWLLCAATLPRRREHDLFLVDGLHIWPVLMKRLFLRKDQKIVAHLGSHTMYFLASHQFSRSVERVHLWALRNYDALICEGGMTVELVHQVLGDRHPAVYETFIGTPAERIADLSELRPNLNGRRIVFVGSGPGEFRAYYKGLDLMIEAVSIAAESDPAVKFDILGEWDPQIVDALTARIPPVARGRINFRGQVEGIADWFQQAALYLHCARGESFGVAVLEAMTAGVVPLVSEWTGARQAVGDVSPKLIAPLDATEIAKQILWYFALDPDARKRLAMRCCAVAAKYTEETATAHYQATFASMCEDLGLVGPQTRLS